MLIAVTRNDEINMLICQIASLYLKSLKNSKNKISRVSDPKFSTLLIQKILIDYVISPELEITKSLQS